MKSWTKPELVILDVKATQLGYELKTVPDGEKTDVDGYKWYSFS